MTKQAKYIEIGELVLIDGTWRKITGWFFEARPGRIVLEYDWTRRVFREWDELEVAS